MKLNIMDKGTGGDSVKRKGVTGNYVGAFAAYYLIADLEAVRCDNVALFTVLVLYKCNISGTVRIVLKGEYRREHVVLITLKVDYTVLPAVSAALMANGYSAVAVTAGIFLKRSQKTSFGALLGKR